jgi:hypothetical protein
MSKRKFNTAETTCQRIKHNNHKQLFDQFLLHWQSSFSTISYYLDFCNLFSLRLVSKQLLALFYGMDWQTFTEYRISNPYRNHNREAYEKTLKNLLEKKIVHHKSELQSSVIDHKSEFQSSVINPVPYESSWLAKTLKIDPSDDFCWFQSATHIRIFMLFYYNRLLPSFLGDVMKTSLWSKSKMYWWIKSFRDMLKKSSRVSEGTISGVSINNNVNKQRRSLVSLFFSNLKEDDLSMFHLSGNSKVYHSALNPVYHSWWLHLTLNKSPMFDITKHKENKQNVIVEFRYDEYGPNVYRVMYFRPLSGVVLMQETLMETFAFITHRQAKKELSIKELVSFENYLSYFE